MILYFKKYTCLSIMLFCYFIPQSSFANTWNLFNLPESQLLQIIDEEFLEMSDDPENLEWTDDNGIQPKDTYELDYSEKCNFIAPTSNIKALAACAIILAKD